MTEETPIRLVGAELEDCLRHSLCGFSERRGPRAGLNILVVLAMTVTEMFWQTVYISTKSLRRHRIAVLQAKLLES